MLKSDLSFLASLVSLPVASPLKRRSLKKGPMYTLYKRDEGTVPEDLSEILSLTKLAADLFGVLASSLLEEMWCTEKSGSLTFLSYCLIQRWKNVRTVRTRPCYFFLVLC